MRIGAAGFRAILPEMCRLMEGSMIALRLTLIALLAAASLTTASRACNETCADGFLFSDAEGVCVKAPDSV
jgi:hypothetical protein